MATQLERTTRTRARLLEAAVECLVERGYQGTSTAEVCRRSGASRGAQLHHYPTKAALLGAAVEHVMARRHDEFRARFASGKPDLAAAFEHLLGVYLGPTVAAWQELVVAARTDRELREHVVRVERRFVAEAEATFAALLGSDDPAFVRPAARLVMSAFDGLAMNQVLQRDHASARAAVAELARLCRPWMKKRSRR